ncbi:hypothetical protein Tco_0712474 [Tanacetum coccineum]
MTLCDEGARFFVNKAKISSIAVVWQYKILITLYYQMTINLWSIVDGNSSNVLSFEAVAYAFHQDRASSVKVPVANVTLIFLGRVCLQENTDSVRSNQRMRSTAPSVQLKELLALGQWFQTCALELGMPISNQLLDAATSYGRVSRCGRPFWKSILSQHKITRSKNDITSFERGYGMIYNDGDGDNDAYDDDRDDDEREISWYYETTRQHSENNTAECANERAALANLIENLALIPIVYPDVLTGVDMMNEWILTMKCESCWILSGYDVIDVVVVMYAILVHGILHFYD